MQKRIQPGLWLALEQLGLREAWYQEGAAQASESGGVFGLRWNPGFDMLKVPELPGIFVLFFKEEQTQIDNVENMFQRIQQHYRAPGRFIVGFSWIALSDKRTRAALYKRFHRLPYQRLWELQPSDLPELEDAFREYEERVGIAF